jgi:hypothetical protein
LLTRYYQAEGKSPFHDSSGFTTIQISKKARAVGEMKRFGNQCGGRRSNIRYSAQQTIMAYIFISGCPDGSGVDHAK